MKTQTFIINYLEAIGFAADEYTLKITEDELGTLFAILIPSTHSKIGILKGRGGRNLLRFKQLTRVVGLAEGINPFLLVKLTEGT